MKVVWNRVVSDFLCFIWKIWDEWQSEGGGGTGLARPRYSSNSSNMATGFAGLRTLARIQTTARKQAINYVWTSLAQYGQRFPIHLIWHNVYQKNEKRLKKKKERKKERKMATKIVFLATFLGVEVAKRRLTKRLSLEHCNPAPLMQFYWLLSGSLFSCFATRVIIFIWMIVATMRAISLSKL